MNGCLNYGVLIGVEALEDVVFALGGIDAFDGRITRVSSSPTIFSSPYLLPFCNTSINFFVVCLTISSNTVVDVFHNSFAYL